jgi:carboxylesterase
VDLRPLPSDTIVARSALPRFLAGGKAAALLIHGFASTPRETEGLGEALHAAGLTVSIPRLPGHGTNGADFLKTGWRDWLRRCVDEYLELGARYDPLSLVGFSMGGLLAILLAARFPVKSLALLAPPVRTHDPRLPFTPLVGLLVRRARREIVEEPPADPEEALLMREYRGYRYPAQTAGILTLRRLARRALPLVSADTLTIVARHDAYVPVSVIDLIEGKIAARSKRHLVLEGGHRSLLEGSGEEQVRDEVVRWLRG